MVNNFATLLDIQVFGVKNNDTHKQMLETAVKKQPNGNIAKKSN